MFPLASGASKLSDESRDPHSRSSGDLHREVSSFSYPRKTNHGNQGVEVPGIVDEKLKDGVTGHEGSGLMGLQIEGVAKGVLETNRLLFLPGSQEWQGSGEAGICR